MKAPKPPSATPKRPKKAAAAKRAVAPPPTPEAVAAKLLALAPAGELPALWSRVELNRRFTTAEKRVLDAALTHLQEERQVLALSQKKSVFYVFAGPLKAWLAGSAVVEEPPVAPVLMPASASGEELDEAYRRLVRESGGFPDVKISALQAALGTVEAGALAEELVARWRRGGATLSLGDWSLASEETRAAAVELDGERYLLVRLEDL